MATKGTKRHKIARRLLWLIGALLFVLALLPVWFPWLLKPVLNHYGLGFTNYDRIGYTRFGLSGFRGEWKDTRLDAQHVECPLPPAWLWQKLTGRADASAFVRARECNLIIAPQRVEGETHDGGSLSEILDESVRIGAILKSVLHGAELTNCSIQIVSNRIVLPHVSWRGGKADTIIELPQLRGAISFAAQLEGTSALQLSAISDAYESSVRGRFSKAADGWRWQGEVTWFTNQAEVSVQFPTDGWLPAHAQLKCPHLSVPAKLIQPYGYENLTATLSANVTSNHFSVDATGVAQPANDSAAGGLAAAEFSVALDGDPGSVFFRMIRIQSPWLRAELTSPVGMTWAGELSTNLAQFTISADLAKLPGATLAGYVRGLVRVEPHGLEAPTAQFSFSATNLQAWQADAQNIRIEGEYASARLRLNDIAAELADGSKLAASGAVDFTTREVVGGNLKFSGGFLGQMLPGWDYDDLSGSVELRGPFTNLAHEGIVTLKGFRGDKLKPLNANANWNGHNLRLDSMDVELTAGESTLSVAGTLDLSALGKREISATLTNSSLRRGKTALYSSQRPCAISFVTRGTNTGLPDWSLAVDALDWQGDNRGISLAANLSWPTQGLIRATVTNFALNHFADFLTNDIANLLLPTLELSAHWSNGPVHSAISIVGNLTNRSGQTFILRGALATDETISVNQLSLATEYTPTLSVTGNVPVKIIPGRTEGWLSWDESRTIALTGNWEAQQSRHFSVPLPSLGELDVARPQLAFQISGTLEKPTALLTAAAESINWVAVTNAFQRPELKDLRLRVEVQPSQIKLETFGAKLDGQLIEANGEWPITTEDWKAFWGERKMPDWSQAHGRLQAEGAQIAALSRYLPQVLAPEGRLSATLELKTGKQLDGTVSVTNAASRPLGKLTPLRDIAALVRFDRKRAVLERFQGQIGGQPLLADGFVTNPTEGALDYQVNLHGTNVPVARSLELLLRGDVDLRLRGGGNGPPVLSGSVNLHDGLFVQHASALVWGGPKRPELLPPYFSVTDEPVANWKLDISVTGDRFLRARAPVFSGQLSANGNLKGTLREPILTGDVRVNSGRILFPFGTLNVNQAYISFSGNDPLGPDLQINASGRNYRYDVQLEAKGQANVAEVTFSSTPPLTSEQILLMLTAGELPQTDFAFSSTARAGSLATFLGKDLLSRYLGTGQSEERLIIRTGEGISQEGRLTYSVEYRLTDRWSLIGEYDEFNAFNADLKWKILVR